MARWFQRCRRCWWQLLYFFFFLPLRVFFFSSFSVLSPFSLYSLSYLFLCPLSSVFSAPSFFLVLSLVFIGKTGEREAGGGHCAATPKTRGKLRASGVGQRLFEREMAVENRGRKKIFFFPCFARPGEEEDIWCHSKRHHFCFFFFSFLFFCMNGR